MVKKNVRVIININNGKVVENETLEIYYINITYSYIWRHIIYYVPSKKHYF